jgi:hypothetical protein
MAAMQVEEKHFYLRTATSGQLYFSCSASAFSGSSRKSDFPRSENKLCSYFHAFNRNRVGG